VQFLYLFYNACKYKKIIRLFLACLVLYGHCENPWYQCILTASVFFDVHICEGHKYVTDAWGVTSFPSSCVYVRGPHQGHNTGPFIPSLFLHSTGVITISKFSRSILLTNCKYWACAQVRCLRFRLGWTEWVKPTLITLDNLKFINDSADMLISIYVFFLHFLIYFKARQEMNLLQFLVPQQ
jgi:hypothetical protein